jgi:hypothetical protein
MSTLLTVNHDAEEPNAWTKLHATAVHPADLQDVLGRALTDDEAALLHEFEQSWKLHVRRQAELVPEEEALIQQLETKAHALVQERQAIEEDLRQQEALVQSQEEAAEAEFAQKMQQAEEDYAQSEQELTEHLQEVEQAQKLQEETMPWSFFLSAADAAAREESSAYAGLEKSLTVQPSQRAIYLAQRMPSMAVEEKENDSDGEESTDGDVDTKSLLRALRAYEMDQTLLTTQLAMLKKEIQRYESTIASQQRAQTLLLEHNIWGILDQTHPLLAAQEEEAASPVEGSSEELVETLEESDKKLVEEWEEETDEESAEEEEDEEETDEEESDEDESDEEEEEPEHSPKELVEELTEKLNKKLNMEPPKELTKSLVEGMDEPLTQECDDEEPTDSPAEEVETLANCKVSLDESPGNPPKDVLELAIQESVQECLEGALEVPPEASPKASLEEGS